MRPKASELVKDVYPSVKLREIGFCLAQTMAKSVGRAYSRNHSSLHASSFNLISLSTWPANKLLFDEHDL